VQLRLANGLRLFVVERHSAPTFAAVYSFDVGAAEDPRGQSGIAHLLEHMMFTGTRELGSLDRQREDAYAGRLDDLWQKLDAERQLTRRPFRLPDPERMAQLGQQIRATTAEYRQVVAPDEYDLVLDRAGAEDKNAFTNFDSTNYVLQLPKSRLELWFRLESDRLLHPVLRDFYTQREVVRQERGLRLDTTVGGMLLEALQRLLFSAHPYGVPVVGWPGDIEHLHRQDALAYFRTHYTPERCYMVLVGDVRVAEVERLAKQYLGSWAAGAEESSFRATTPEPEQHGERRRVIELDAQPRLMLGWATVPAEHPDRFALEVLARVLGGMNHSRLSRGLGGGTAWHSALATAGYLVAGVSPGESRRAMQRQEARLWRAIAQIQNSGITTAELLRAQLEIQNRYLPGLDDDLGLAERIARAAAEDGSPDYLRTYPQRIAAVTAAQVQQVARRYLRPERKCVVELRRPARKAGPGLAVAAEATAPHRTSTPSESRGHSAAYAALLNEIKATPPPPFQGPVLGKDVERLVLPSGITLFLQEDHTRPTVSLRLAWRGGVNTAQLGELPAYHLASGLLSSGGTTSLSRQELAEQQSELGMSFRLELGETLCQARLSAPAQNLAQAVDLAADVLLHPRLSEGATWRAKLTFAAAMRARGESLHSGAEHLLDHVLLGDHPRLGYVPGKWRLYLATWPYQVRRLWRRYLGRDNLYIAAVGDFDRQALIERIESTLGRWRKAQDSRQLYLARPPSPRPGAFLVKSPRAGVAVALAHPIAIDRRAPASEHAALRVLLAILGGRGLQSRLGHRLRTLEGLTYHVSASLSHEGHPGEPGELRISYQTQTGQAARSLACALEELERLRREEVSPAELEEQLAIERSREVFDYADRFTNVSRLMLYELDGRPFDYDQQRLEADQKVTPADVLRVAQKYLQPEKLSVALYGTLSSDEEAQLRARFSLRLLSRKDVFRGGYD
jgi:predicted Zn-dependent peptidase